MVDPRMMETLDKLAAKRGWSAEKKKAAIGILEEKAADAADWTEEARGLAAIPMEAMSLGILGDEARAAGRAAIAKAADFVGGTEYAGSFSEEYEMALKDEREVESETYRDLPVAAYGLNIAFGIVPAAKIATAAGVGTSAASGAARQGLSGAAEAGLYGFMEGDGDLATRAKSGATAAAIGGTLAGGVGALMGKSAGKKVVEEAKKKVFLEEVAKKEADLQKGIGLGEEVSKRMTEKATAHLAQTGEELVDGAYMSALKQTAKELGVPYNQVKNADGLKFFEGDKLIKQVDDYVPEELSRKQIGWARDLWRNGITPIVKKAETVVGKEFSGQLQRYATRMAQRGDKTTTVFRSAPVKAFSRVIQNDSTGTIRSHILNMSNLDLPDGDRGKFFIRAMEAIREQGGEEAVDGFRRIQTEMVETQKRQNKLVNGFIEPDPLYWPAQFKNNSLALRGRDGTAKIKQDNLKVQERGVVTPEQALRFENPAIHADNWLRQADGLEELYSTFNLQNAKGKIRAEEIAKGKPFTEKQLNRKIKQAQAQQAGGEQAFVQLRDKLIEQGADQGTADHAVTLMRSVAVNGSRGPSSLISNFRKGAYMGTIGNPYSAVLNLGDVFNSMVNFGVKNTTKGLVDSLRKKGIDVRVDDIGLLHQTTGEFLRDGVSVAQQRFDFISDLVFQVSAFRKLDRIGKNTTIRASLNNNKSLAADGAKFGERWKGIFTPDEIKTLRKDILQDNPSQLVKEMAAAELAKMQPTDMANLPQWFLDHPNARVLYMLRTFGLKQIQQIDDLVVKQWNMGNKAEAAKNALAYTAIVGGGNAVIQEGRQVIKKKETNWSLNPADQGVGYRFADHMLGSLSANTLSLYAINRTRAEDSGTPLVTGALPPLAMAVAPIVDALQIADADGVDVEEALQESDVIGWLPWGRLAQDWMKDD